MKGKCGKTWGRGGICGEAFGCIYWRVSLSTLCLLCALLHG